jgi:hypothetical protein
MPKNHENISKNSESLQSKLNDIIYELEKLAENNVSQNNQVKESAASRNNNAAIEEQQLPVIRSNGLF